MELIYAFMDESGHWYGEPDADTDGGAPREDTLIYQPLPGMDGALSPFSGQRLRVRYADILRRPMAQVSYQLEGGGSYVPTSTVYELLTRPSRAWVTAIPQQRTTSTLEEGDRPAPDAHGH